jgi:hypothetical protein
MPVTIKIEASSNLAVNCSGRRGGEAFYSKQAAKATRRASTKIFIFYRRTV